MSMIGCRTLAAAASMGERGSNATAGAATLPSCGRHAMPQRTTILMMTGEGGGATLEWPQPSNERSPVIVGSGQSWRGATNVAFGSTLTNTHLELISRARRCIRLGIGSRLHTVAHGHAVAFIENSIANSMNKSRTC
jgi:hypothetical protein